jgi:hypothetical protein
MLPFLLLHEMKYLRKYSNVDAGINLVWLQFVVLFMRLITITGSVKANDNFLISNQDTIIFDFSNAVCASGYMEVPVRFNSDEQVYAMDFALKFNPAVFTYISVTTHKAYLSVSANYNSGDSTLRFSSSSLQVIDNNTTLVSVRFSLPVSQIDYTDFVSVYTLLNGDDCSAKAIEPLPAGSITPGGDTSILPGDSLSLSFVPNPALSYIWSTGQTASTIYVNTPGIYSLTTYYGNGCQTVNSILITEANPLPVTYLYFDAFQDGENVEVVWATATELNCDYFNIERSSDLEDWITLASVEGAGNSNTLSDYTFADIKPLSGLNYYRLKQVDYNGEFSHSLVIAVDFDTPLSETELKIFPNPVSGNKIHFKNRGFNASTVSVRLTSILGKSFEMQHVEYQNNIGVVTLPDAMADGFYFITVSDGFKTLSTPFFFNK